MREIATYFFKRHQFINFYTAYKAISFGGFKSFFKE